MTRSTTIGMAVAATLFAGLAARPAWRAQNNNTPAEHPRTSTRFAFAGNVAQVPAEFIGNLIFVPVKVNQSLPSLFQLDTTAAFSSVDPERATELGLASTQGAILSLTGADFALPNFAQVAHPEFGARVGRAYEGTVGNDAISDVVVEMDYARQTVRLSDPAAFQYSGQAKSLPLTFRDGMPVVRAKFEIAGHKSGEAEFVLNTALGASLVISDKFAQQHHLFTSHMKTIPVAAGELGVGGNAVIGRLENFQIGSYVIQAPLAAFAQGQLPGDGGAQFAGEIGAGTFRRFTVILDYTRQVAIFDSNSEFRSDDREDMSGISIAASGPGLKTFEVTQVRNGTPGSDAGVQKGDVLAGVDEEAAADLTLTAIRDLFRQVGHKYKLLIERNGKALTVNITMRRSL
jgi:PDZ domain-containing protein